ncbi:MAG: hypothetical protein LBM77_08570 [Spirochaetaceae bacterium]|jgi:hypothetical protein|nr:hypothetical protein [Spirochaetaceae bacterium]
MGKMVYSEIDITKGVPEEVKERVRANLEGREIDFSDIPELTEEDFARARRPNIDRILREELRRMPVILDDAAARYVEAQAYAKHETPSELITEMVHREMAYA